MSLETDFDHEMVQIYYRAKSEAGYTASIFWQMLERNRGLTTARYLISTDKPSDGYTALHLKGRLDLTVEALIFDNPRFHELFTAAELQKIERRLRAYEYTNALNRKSEGPSP